MINLFRDRLTTVIANKRFRRLVGPEWETLAAAIVDKVVAELGVKTASVTIRFHPEEQKHPDFNRIIEEELLKRLGHVIARSAPRETVANYSREPEGMIEVTMRALVITKLPEIEP